MCSCIPRAVVWCNRNYTMHCGSYFVRQMYCKQYAVFECFSEQQWKAAMHNIVLQYENYEATLPTVSRAQNPLHDVCARGRVGAVTVSTRETMAPPLSLEFQAGKAQPLVF